MSKKASKKAQATTTPDKHEYTCPTCDMAFESPKQENLRCPVCKTSMIIRLKPRKENYVTGLGVTVSGRDTVDIGDHVATYLRGASAQDAIELAADALDTLDPTHAYTAKLRRHRKGFDGTTAEFLANRYEGRNDGMIRMNVGNILRSALKRQAEATA